MADPKIRIKRSSVAGKKPSTSNIVLGELALNTTDGDLYTIRERVGFATDVVNLGAGATVTNILYVTKDGNNSNTGKKLGDAKATIGAALTEASAGTVIKVSAGSYIENNPLTLPADVSIVGDNLREVSILPQNSNQDIFYLDNACYVTEMSFTGSLDSGKAIFAFNPSAGVVTVTRSPYVQNCTNFISNSIGMRVDGDYSDGDLKSMVLDSYTQYNQGGIGVSITNNGYAQLVSLFTICNDIAVYCGSGGGCDLTNSNSSFGNYGLVADGVGVEEFVGVITETSTANDSTFVLSGLGNTRPYDGQVVYFDELYYTVNKIVVSSGGTGYTSTPTVTIDSPGESWGIDATAIAEISNGSVTGITVASSGRGFGSTPPTVTIGAPDVGVNTATATASVLEEYYVIESATPVSSGISTITISDNLPYVVGVGTTVPFFKQSRIIASGHSFEHIGSGVTISTALPQKGGVTIQENEVDSRSGGLVIYSSTDQAGNFRIGDGVLINQQTGNISGVSYSKSLFTTLTPFILALGGD